MKFNTLRNAIRFINKIALTYSPVYVVATVGITDIACAQGVNTAAQKPADARQQFEEIEVIGISGSLRQALAVKENAASVVDAISAEDVGKFPDKNVGDALQRIPGVSLSRIWGEGRDIFIRGTNNDLNRTLLNGQNVATAYWWANDNMSRGFNYQILPSDIISVLKVYKSPTADRDEGSIGGTVNVNTRRPMNMDRFSATLSVEAQHSELPDKLDPQISALVNWHNETFGVIGSITLQERTARRDGLEGFNYNAFHSVTNADTGEVTNNVYTPWGQGSAIFQQDIERKTVNIGFQYQPNDSLDIFFNNLIVKMDMDNNNQNYLGVLGGIKLSQDNVAISNPIFRAAGDGNPTLVGGTDVDPNTTGAAYESFFRRGVFVNTAIHDIEADYTGDGFRVHAQLGITKAEGGSDHTINYWFDAPTRASYNLNGVVEINYLDLNPNDATALRFRPGNTQDRIRKMEDSEHYLQGDLAFDMEWGMINEAKIGLKLRDHTVENNRILGLPTNNTHPSFALLEAITLDQISTGSVPRLHGEAGTAGSLTTYPNMDNGLIRHVIDPLLADVMVYDIDRNAFFEINEEIIALYGMASFTSDHYRGNFGVRYVNTDQTSKAYQGPANNLSIQTDTRDYADFLPSVNLIVDLSDNLLLRTAASRAMARPTYTQLSSNLVIDATTNATANAGNPNLKPTYSDQFDIGLEWYFDDAAILSATYFSKNLSTFIVNESAVETINGQTLSVTRPRNAPGSGLQGIEFQWQQKLGGGFGATANYTWTDADVVQDGSTELILPGNSENQFNASIYFENSQYSARLSYNNNSKQFGRLVAGSQLITEAYYQWDATANWSPTETIEVFLTMFNITNEVLTTKTGTGVPEGIYENGARYTIGGRMKF